MKNCFIYLLLLLSNFAVAQFQGPVAPVSLGYGAPGSIEVWVENIRNDHFFLNDISVFYPSETSSPIPTIFFAHGYGGNDTIYYIETLRHFASIGYAVVFVPYKTLGVTIEERYLTLFDGFIKAAQNMENIIDTTRVGFFGHSFGGGATPGVSYKLFKERNWGQNGKFIYCSAPWYSYELGTSNLDNFPTDCNMLTVLYDQDDVNDHRMGMDIFTHIAISDANKDCIIVGADTVNGYVYEAGHSCPSQYSPNGVFDAYDYWITFRLLSALADYSFTGNTDAKKIALGNGGPEQVYMGEQLKPLSSTDNPYPLYDQSKYQFQCDTIINERQAYCQTILGKNEKLENNFQVSIFPNPASKTININTPPSITEFMVTIYSTQRQMICSFQNKAIINLEGFKEGLYWVEINMDGIIQTEKLYISSP